MEDQEEEGDDGWEASMPLVHRCSTRHGKDRSLLLTTPRRVPPSKLHHTGTLHCSAARIFLSKAVLCVWRHGRGPAPPALLSSSLPPGPLPRLTSVPHAACTRRRQKTRADAAWLLCLFSHRWCLPLACRVDSIVGLLPCGRSLFVYAMAAPPPPHAFPAKRETRGRGRVNHRLAPGG